MPTPSPTTGHPGLPNQAAGQPALRRGTALRRGAWLAGLLAAGLLPAGPARPQQAAAQLYAGADMALGAQLLHTHRCAECHVRRVGGDGAAIYRPLGRIGTPAALRGMVEQCNLELNLALFPDEVTAIAAVLNRDHYRFK